MKKDIIKRREFDETATVVSAISLTKDELAQIKEIISKKLSKEIEVKNQVNKSVIAGLYIRIGDRVFDSTFRRKIDQLKERLLP